VLQYAGLLLLTLAAVGPFLWLLSTALKSSGENIYSFPPRFLPQSPTLGNFVEVWRAVPMADYFTNSLVVTLLTVALTLATSVLAAYPLARMRFPGRNLFFYAVIASMMIPFQVIMIPVYLMMLGLGLDDNGDVVRSWLALSLPYAVSGFGILFLRQAMKVIPKALEESAMLDGCNGWQTLRYVILPLIRPSLATLAVFTFIAIYGEFLWPSIILSNPKHFTLPVGLVQLQGAFSANWRLIAAGTVLSMAPILLMFVFLQRYIMAGSLAGSIKE
jgi:putative chitobiose transport system permease protein